MICIACEMAHQRMQVALAMVVVAILVVLPCRTIGASSSSTTTAGCNFPASSMVSTTSCSAADSETSLSGLISCLLYLEEDESAPNARCCAGVKNMSALHTPCLCKVTFYPPQGVNVTRQKLMPGLCNVTYDLCTVCPAFLVNRVDENMAAPASGDEIKLYKKKVIGLAVVLGLIMACVIVGVALIVRRKLKDRKSQPPIKVKQPHQTRQPGSDY